MRNTDYAPLAAAIVSVLIILGIIVLAVFNRVVPDVLKAAAGASVTWLFVASAQRGTSPPTEGGTNP